MVRPRCHVHPGSDPDRVSMIYSLLPCYVSTMDGLTTKAYGVLQVWWLNHDRPRYIRHIKIRPTGPFFMIDIPWWKRIVIACICLFARLAISMLVCPSHWPVKSFSGCNIDPFAHKLYLGTLSVVIENGDDWSWPSVLFVAILCNCMYMYLYSLLLGRGLFTSGTDAFVYGVEITCIYRYL